MQGFQLADISEGDICNDLEIILGIDYIFKFLLAQNVADNVCLLPSKLGNVVVGTVPPEKNPTTAITTVLRIGCSGIDTEDSSHVTMNESLRRCWDLEIVGLNREEVSEDSVLRNFNESISYENGRYIVALPWKESHPKLEPNYFMAEKRLFSTLDILRKNPSNLSQYDKVIQGQLQSDFIERVNDPSIS